MISNIADSRMGWIFHRTVLQPKVPRQLQSRACRGLQKDNVDSVLQIDLQLPDGDMDFPFQKPR